MKRERSCVVASGLSERGLLELGEIRIAHLSEKREVVVACLLKDFRVRLEVVVGEKSNDRFHVQWHAQLQPAAAARGGRRQCAEPPCKRVFGPKNRTRNDALYVSRRWL